MNGRTSVVIETAALADVAPTPPVLYVDTGNVINRVYGDIMAGVQILAQPANSLIEHRGLIYLETRNMSSLKPNGAMTRTQAYFVIPARQPRLICMSSLPSGFLATFMGGN